MKQTYGIASNGVVALTLISGTRRFTLERAESLATEMRRLGADVFVVNLESFGKES